MTTIPKKALEEITADLVAGKEVNLPGIGKLIPIVRSAREGRNPATGATISIPERKALRFRQSSVIGQALNPGLSGDAGAEEESGD